MTMLFFRLSVLTLILSVGSAKAYVVERSLHSNPENGKMVWLLGHDHYVGTIEENDKQEQSFIDITLNRLEEDGFPTTLLIEDRHAWHFNEYNEYEKREFVEELRTYPDKVLLVPTPSGKSIVDNTGNQKNASWLTKEPSWLIYGMLRLLKQKDFKHIAVKSIDPRLYLVMLNPTMPESIKRFGLENMHRLLDTINTKPKGKKREEIPGSIDSRLLKRANSHGEVLKAQYEPLKTLLSDFDFKEAFDPLTNNQTLVLDKIPGEIKEGVLDYIKEEGVLFAARSVIRETLWEIINSENNSFNIVFCSNWQRQYLEKDLIQAGYNIIEDN